MPTTNVVSPLEIKGGDGCLAYQKIRQKKCSSMYQFWRGKKMKNVFAIQRQPVIKSQWLSLGD